MGAPVQHLQRISSPLQLLLIPVPCPASPLTPVYLLLLLLSFGSHGAVSASTHACMLGNRYCSPDAAAEAIEVRSINNEEVRAQQVARLQVRAPPDRAPDVSLSSTERMMVMVMVMVMVVVMMMMMMMSWDQWR